MSNEDLKRSLTDIIALAIKQVSLMDSVQMKLVIKAIYEVQDQLDKLIDGSKG